MYLDLFYSKAFLIFFFLGKINSTNTTAKYPEWPWDFRFELAGNVGSDKCVQIAELLPLEHFWYDNYFCVKQGPEYKDIGLMWSPTGPVSGKKCILTNEPSASIVWVDNHICFDNDVPYDLQWSYKGCIKDKACISWDEPWSPKESTYWDNYLCATKTVASNTYAETKCSSGGHMDKGFTLALLITIVIAAATFFM